MKIKDLPQELLDEICPPKDSLDDDIQKLELDLAHMCNYHKRAFMQSGEWCYQVIREKILYKKRKINEILYGKVFKG